MSENVNKLRTYLPLQLELGEGPRWYASANQLYCVNILQGEFYCHDPVTGLTRSVKVDTTVGCLGLRQGGGLVLGTGQGFAFWDEKQGLRFLPGLSFDPATRFNDGAVDRAGRFWAGTKAPSGQARLYRLDGDGSIRLIDTGFTICNGLGWSPDNHTMYFTDSTPQTIYAYDFDLSSGEIANRRVFARIHDPGVDPDGLAVDAEGGVWSALWDGWRVVRFDPQGKIEREIRVPAARVTACTFAGPGLNELIITTARWKLNDAHHGAQPQAGDLFTVPAGVQGLPEPLFAGQT